MIGKLGLNTVRFFLRWQAVPDVEGCILEAAGEVVTRDGWTAWYDGALSA